MNCIRINLGTLARLLTDERVQSILSATIATAENPLQNNQSRIVSIDATGLEAVRDGKLRQLAAQVKEEWDIH